MRVANPDAVIAVDEEGGDVSRLHTRTPSPVLGAAALGGAGDLALTEDVGAWVGHELASLGVTLDLAPDADVNSDPLNPVIGTRSFGTEPHRVAEHVAAWTRGLQSAGVAACAKHFPGHGDTATDSHLSLPVVDVDADTLAARELVPFDAAVEAGTAAVMTSHILVPALDPHRPATLSPVVLGMLRDVLEFDGVVVSDALDMAGASAGRGIPEAAVLALVAGCDLLCLGPDKPAALVLEVRDAVVAAVADGRLGADRLADAAARVRAMRVEATVSPTLPDHGRQVAAATAGMLREGELPDLTGAVVVTVETAANIAVGDVAWGIVPDHRTGPDDAAGLPDGVPLVVQVRDAARRPEVLELLRSLAHAGRTAVVVEWGWPAAYDVGLPRLAPRGSSAPGSPRSRPSCARPAGRGEGRGEPRPRRPHRRARHRRHQDPRRGPRARRDRARRGARETVPGAEGLPPQHTRCSRRCAARPACRSPAGSGGVPGLVDVGRGVLRHAVNLGVDGDELPLRSLLAERLGVPVVVENDVNAAALAARALAGVDDVVYLSLGTASRPVSWSTAGCAAARTVPPARSGTCRSTRPDLGAGAGSTAASRRSRPGARCPGPGPRSEGTPRRRCSRPRRTATPRRSPCGTGSAGAWPSPCGCSA